MNIDVTRLMAKTLQALPKRRLSRWVGTVASLKPPAAVVRNVIRVYSRIYDVDESDIDVPDHGFQSFDSFFTRSLKPGSRTICRDANTVTSPSDGCIEDTGSVTVGGAIRVKQFMYSLAELLGSEEDARRFEGGSFIVIYLSPRDYHRVHAAVDGPVISVRQIPGTLYPVNSISRFIPQVYSRNERIAVWQTSAGHGDVATIMVGAMSVGRITLAFDPRITTNRRDRRVNEFAYSDGAVVLERGQELGTFHLGSTVVLVVSRPVRFLRSAGDFVRLGEPLARGVL